MTNSCTPIDVLGIGFGPSQLALGIAAADAGLGDRIRFIESHSSFAWHPDMLVPGATMQVNFTKDLVTPRDPTHRLSFLNYLHVHGRFADFTNLKTMFPLRAEFGDYLAWAARECSAQVDYGVRAASIAWLPEQSRFEVRCTDGRSYLARHLVTGLGLEPQLPAGIARSSRIWHSEHHLSALTACTEPIRRVVVIGGGQSAAEVVEHVRGAAPDAAITVVMRRFGFSPADDSPFVNRVFNPEHVDECFSMVPAARARLLADHRSTNYTAVDGELIDTLARLQYADRVAGRPRIEMRTMSELVSAAEETDGVRLAIRDLRDGGIRELGADVVICATGYRPSDPRRLFVDPGAVFPTPEEAPEIDRGYRLRANASVTGTIWAIGLSEHVHGLGTTLLSNVAVRAGELRDSIRAELDADPGSEPDTASADLGHSPLATAGGALR